MTTSIDPILEPLLDEQRRYNASVGLAPPPPQPPSPDQLAAHEQPLPDRPQLKVRVLQPPGALRGVYLHSHGGGFKFGTPAMADRTNSELARAASMAVVSVDYRLAPAHVHPAALEDCEAAALWLIEHARERFGTDRLLIGGDSVGATLSVMTLLRLRDRHGFAMRFRGANLVAGAFDFSMTPSQMRSSEALFLSPARLAETREAAFPGVSGEALRDPHISPLYADLAGLPPALFSVGANDAVIDDSMFMCMRWRAAGAPAQLEVYPEGTHTFLSGPTRLAAEARRRIAEFMRQRLAN